MNRHRVHKFESRESSVQHIREVLPQVLAKYIGRRELFQQRPVRATQRLLFDDPGYALAAPNRSEMVHP